MKRYFENKRKHNTSFTLFSYLVTLTGNILSTEQVICAVGEQTRKKIKSLLVLAQQKSGLQQTQSISLSSFFPIVQKRQGFIQCSQRKLQLRGIKSKKNQDTQHYFQSRQFPFNCCQEQCPIHYTKFRLQVIQMTHNITHLTKYIERRPNSIDHMHLVHSVEI